MRPFGVPEVGGISSPAHLLHLYEHGAQFLDLSARFCRAGLEHGECCTWVAAPPWKPILAHLEIMKHVPNASQYVETGQLQFVAYEEWYLAGGNDVEATLGRASARITEATHNGWAHVRACGNALQPLTSTGWTKRVQYEEALHQFMQQSDVICLCSYRLASLPHGIQAECRSTHHAVITHSSGGLSYSANDESGLISEP